MKNLAIYNDTKRNEKCPCGSGKIFKKCCMKEYREAKKRGEKANLAKFSTFSPIKSLEQSDAKSFMKYYDKILLFSYKYRTNSKMIVEDDFAQFLSRERDYFYEDREAILEKFIEEHSPSKEESEIIEAIRESRYDLFILLEYGEKTAVISDTKGDTYNVQTLTTPFNEMFTKRPIMMQTALIPYKNRYILDGRYAVVQEKMSRAIQKEIDVIPTLGRQTHFQKEETINFFPITINLTLFSDAIHFEKMEDIVLRNIPDDFTQKMLDLFKDTPFERSSFVSSFVRSMDFLSETQEDELKELNLLNGISISNYEVNGDNSVIPYNILEKYYNQKSLDKSISDGVYKNVQNAKAIVRDGGKNILQASSFYSMLGVFYIHDYNIDEFKFLEQLHSEDARRVFSQEIEKLFDTINANIDFDITPVFLDFALDLDGVIDEIDEFREYLGELFVRGNPKQMMEYSIYKGKKPNIFTKIMNKK